ncbi:hypothetical protein TNCT_464931, partial [Trichonephila clavata]
EIHRPSISLCDAIPGSSTDSCKDCPVHNRKLLDLNDKSNPSCPVSSMFTTSPHSDLFY